MENQKRVLNLRSTQQEISSNSLANFVMKSLHNDVETSDIKFCFNSAVLLAHKAILAGGSPVFRTMFYGPMKETGSVKIEDSSPNIFEKFLEFFYNPNPLLEVKQTSEVMSLADKYDTQQCLSFCKKFLLETKIDAENICGIIDALILFDMPDLKVKAEFFIGNYAHLIFRTESFFCCHELVLGYILRMDRLGNASEIDVFEAAMKWAQNHKFEVPFVSNRAIGPEIRIKLSNNFYLIRFPTMDEKLFLTKVRAKYPDLFSDAECLELLEYMIAQRPLKTLTKFSTKKRLHPLVEIARQLDQGFTHTRLRRLLLDQAGSSAKIPLNFCI